MRLLAISLLTVALLVMAGCARQSGTSSDRSITVRQNDAPASAPKPATSESSDGKAATVQDGEMVKASLVNAQNAQTSVTERKIIRNADLILETGDPAAGQRKVASIAESRGGFVITSESKQRNAEGQLKPEMVVTITIRVPAAQFDAVINEIRGAGSRVAQEKVTGQDVTEEYIDLEARIRAKQALEAQFMEIMKQAKSVQDALEVQRQLAEVRSEIERIEGRRRFLENQSSLSTINVTLQPPTQIVSSAGFFYSVKRAFSEGLDVAANITLFFIQALVALLPILIFIVLPIFLLARYLVRRAQRQLLARRVAQPPPSATST
ncbi:MAG TPA: DUF4349 domain-containing protein [Pyrinomonadaceae bacterium]|nr:DUF4349 domain-containing protein [Pyrinomonadaceae bacterium]